MSYVDYVVNTSAPLGIWGLDEASGVVAADSSGNNYDGAHGGGVAVGEPPLIADGGHACHYTAGAHTAVGDTAAMQNLEEFSVEFWINSQLSVLHAVFDKWYDDGGTKTYGISVRVATNGAIQVWTGSGGVSNDGPLSQAGLITPDSTHYVCITQTTRYIFMTVDDTLQFVTGRRHTIGGAGADLWLGARRLGEIDGNAHLDAVAFYDRALPRPEQQLHYIAGQLGTVEFSGTDYSSFGTEVRAVGWNNGALLGRATTDPNDGSYTLHVAKGDTAIGIVNFPGTGIRPKAHGPFTL